MFDLNDLSCAYIILVHDLAIVAVGFRFRHEYDEVTATEDVNPSPVYNGVPSDHFLLMQEPIVEDPRQVQYDVISMLENDHSPRHLDFIIHNQRLVE
jgi:hypothetical protein